MLHFDGVTVDYPAMSRPALADLHLRIHPGERVALAGPSGAGKSTILGLAAGLIMPSAGSVTTLGVDTIELGRRRHRAIRRRIGVISQDYALVGPLRTATNVAAGRIGSTSTLGTLAMLWRPRPIDEISAALDTVGIGDKLWERTDQLSGGEQQRTAIARSLFQQPDLLLADEPVSALDPARSEAVMHTLGSHVASGTRALVVSMHDPTLARLTCDRVVALRDGRVVFDRASSEVTEDMLADLYRLDDSPS